MKLLVFAGSLRKASFNKKLARHVQHLLKSEKNVSVDYLDLNDYLLPSYDGDIEAKGFPEPLLKLVKCLKSYDGYIISSPEYNRSIPGHLKNTVDWISRVKPVPLSKKPMLLMGATPGPLGTFQGQWQTRIPFEAMGVFVFPSVFGLSNAETAFDDKGELVNEADKKYLASILKSFMSFALKVSNEDTP